jgi:uncharacterized protein YjdB
MKNKKLLLLLIVFGLCLPFACEKEDEVIKVISVSMSENRMTLTEGDVNKLHVTFNPENATNKNVTWKSSDASIVSVDQKGELVAKKFGKAIITVTTEVGNKQTTCEVTVEPKTIPITSIALDFDTLTLVEGDSKLLISTIEPSNATNKNVIWKTSNDSIASVDQNGKVIANSAGNATITVTTEQGNIPATCEVIVEPKIIPVTSILLNFSSLELIEGDSKILIPIVHPLNATNKNVTWQSSNDSIASVDQNGRVIAISAGNATITVTSEQGNITATCTVVVEPSTIEVTSISLNKTSLLLNEGTSEILSATIEPKNATNKNVTWKSDNTSIATVDSNGRVSGVNAGSTTIIVKTEDGNKTASCDVTVTSSWLTLSRESIHISGAEESFFINVDASEDWSILSKPNWITVTPSSIAGGNRGTSSVKVSVSGYSGLPVYRSGEIIFTLNGKEQNAILTIDQYNFPYKDGDYMKVQSSTKGNGIDLVFLGDGYTIEDIGKGTFLKNLNDAIEHFFDIEPYRTYRNYFDVYIVYAFSEESGISDHSTSKNTKFSAKYEDPNSTTMSADNSMCFDYALKVPLSSTLSETLITVITNSSRYAGTNWTYSNGMAISIIPVSNLPYPYDFRGVVQHEAGGHGFGKLADEYVTSNKTIPANEKEDLKLWQQWGFFLNVDLTNNLNDILWKQFIGESKYPYVGAHEGGHYYAYGVWRPEDTSLMINNIAYINAPGRELIVKRIKRLAGETFSFEEFKAKDIRETQALTRSASVYFDSKMALPPPVLIKVN